MTEYLHGVHYQYATDEEPLRLDAPRFLAELDTRDRHFWLWRTDDDSGRRWNVIIGTGRSPLHDDDRNCHRWIYAEEATQEEPRAVLLQASEHHP